jgi:SAM-dependent methyltransferase
VFDAVYGSSTLHHLNIDQAAKEVHRILKPGGHAVFREPFDQSAILAVIGKIIFAITPLRPDSVTPQRQLNDNDIKLLQSIFSHVRVRPFGIFNRVDRFIGYEPILRRVNALDKLLLQRFPSLMQYARHIVIECIK